ncbi:MAG: ZIP family metal transporter [Methanobacteriota archaeon]
MPPILWILLATFLVSLIAFVGAFTLAISPKVLEKLLLSLVGLAAGTLIGGAFLHLMPEALDEMAEVMGHAESQEVVMLMVIAGFVIFFILEKLLWRHCHKDHCEIHTFAYLNLAGDGVHNFLDGLIIAAGFLAGPEIGVVTTMAVAFHEIPQEIGDFGVLVHGGVARKKALMFNFATALAAVAGGLLGYFLIPEIGGFEFYILPFAAGGFLYIAAADLIPELHKESNTVRTILAFGMFLVGIAMMWAMKYLIPGAH